MGVSCFLDFDWLYNPVLYVLERIMSLEQVVGQLLLLALPKTYCMSEVVSVSQLAWPIVREQCVLSCFKCFMFRYLNCY